MKPVPPPADLPDLGIAARAGLVRWLRLAWAVLLWERLWPLVLPPLCLAGLFVAFALLDLGPMLPGWLHGLVLAGTAGGLAYLGVRAAIRLRLPGWAEAARRLERDSGLTHRPLDALYDHPAADDPLALALWHAHQRRMAALLGRLRLGLPHPNMAARDPWGLRAAVLLILVIAMVGARDDAPRRLARALHPDIAAAGLGPDSLEVWITPPAYTGLAPLLLKPDMPKVAVPAGSVVLSVLSGGWGGATLSVAGLDQPFRREGDSGQRAEASLDRSGRLAIRQAGLTVAKWEVTATPDALPSIAFSAPPEAGERGRLKLSVTASDDYGVAKAWVSVRRLGLGGQEPLRVELPLPGGRPREADIASWHDLTAHPWAGLPVTMQPEVQDGLGQTGAGEPITLTLPERQFHNPVAAAIAAARRQLSVNAEQAAPEAIALLDRIALDPGLFNDDLKTFLFLRTARHGLDADDIDVDEVQELMWQAALRLEDGDLPAAERGLEEARRALEKAVDDNAPAEELQRLLDQFAQALERYTQALAEHMANSGRPPPLPQADGRVIGEDELRQMVEGLRDMAATGSREALKQMLSEMGQILDGLQQGSQAQANGPASQGMQQLRELAKRQQQMLDASHAQARQQSEGQPGGGQGAGKGQSGPAGGGGGGSGAQAAAQQQELRKALAETARKLGDGLGEAPAPLADADRAMDDAAGSLAQGQWSDAAGAQAQALAALQQAARQAIEQMGKAGQGMQGVVPRDPLGRPSRGSGVGDDGTTRIPDRADIQRSRELLNEIRRRAGETQRPEPERDYLHRLLKQF